MTAKTGHHNLSPQLFRLVYMSRITTKGLTQASILNDIFVSSSDNNSKKYDVTGFLCYGNGYFFQYLEGREKDLTDLKNSLLADRRHTRVKILDFSDIKERRFGKWRMWTIILENGTIKHADLKAFIPFHPDRWEHKEWQVLADKLHDCYANHDAPIEPESWELTPTTKSIAFYRVLKEQRGLRMLFIVVVILMLLLYLLTMFIVSKA